MSFKVFFALPEALEMVLNDTHEAGLLTVATHKIDCPPLGADEIAGASEFLSTMAEAQEKERQEFPERFKEDDEPIETPRELLDAREVFCTVAMEVPAEIAGAGPPLIVPVGGAQAPNPFRH